MKLGQMLLKAGLLDQEQLADALEHQKNDGGRLGYNLVKMNLISEEDLNDYLSKQNHIESVNIDDDTGIPEDVLNLVTAKLALRYEVVPVERRGRKLILAMVDPQNLFTIDDLRFSLGMEIVPHICASSMVQRALKKYYGATDAIVAVEDAEKEKEEELVSSEDELIVGDEAFFSLIEDEEEEEEEEDLTSTDLSNSPVVKLVNSVIADAVNRGASDIHFEPFEKFIRIRYRIDGVLHEIMRPSRKYRQAMVSRLKILGGMNIAEHNLPQDGRTKVRVRDRFVDMRLSTLPTLFGEKVEVRLLDRSKIELNLDLLGFEEETLYQFRRGIKRPYGIVLVTGPSGSGKTTTLYSALTELNDIGVNIMTAENPVEFNLKGINQVQMNSDVGLTFAKALRAYLRQDPDIIMVGEIRDQETSEIAIRAALTGHLVLSTAHTNDAPSTINRLVDMGTEPYMLSTSLVSICSQRLIRKVCNNCKTPVMVPREAMLEAGIEPDRFKGITFYEGTGCSKCNQTGYSGRTGIYEVMQIDDEMRALIESDANSVDLEKAALRKGMINLREAALRKLELGLTTFDEVIRETVSNV
ncbi:MAG: Flp pilus assembly complex ATPase component TadA [Candidatus Sabulitectum sp.]|nr:Flp pilus assembly complex ATPase component TadA [Candidatus Sabulitectum sp.]